MTTPPYKSPSVPVSARHRSTLLDRPMEHFGNRPIDVCALCDRPITKADHGYGGLHVYIGPGMCHGGARENLPVHVVCIGMGDGKYDDERDGYAYEDSLMQEMHVAYYRNNLLPREAGR